jgi:hypothetical protein
MALEVTFVEQTSVRIGEYLRKHGNTPADAAGIMNLNADTETCVGVLKGTHKELAFAFFRPMCRKSFVGVIWIHNERLGASEKQLIFDIYGREHVAFALDLANDLSTYLGTNIRVRLVAEESRLEGFSGDRCE